MFVHFSKDTAPWYINIPSPEKYFILFFAANFLNGVSFLSNEQIQTIINDEKQYEKTPFIFLVFSALRNSLMYAFKNDFIIDSVTESGDWVLIVYKKIGQSYMPESTSELEIDFKYDFNSLKCFSFEGEEI